MTGTHSNKGAALAALCIANFIVILDIAVVNVAIPSIGIDLGVGVETLQWVVIIYALMLGGLLLFGGRAADLFGRRRILVTGVILFTTSSLVAGLAANVAVLITARATQGIGAALIVPSALSILVKLFPEGAERTKALGAFGGVGAAAATFGVVVGGALTSGPGWEWVFYINIPVGALQLVMVLRTIPANRPERGAPTDVTGAVLITLGLLLIAFGISKGPDFGWSSLGTLGSIGLGLALVAAFARVESRVEAPLVPLAIFRRRTLTGANLVAAFIFAALFGNFFTASVFLQGVLGYSALKTGTANLAIGLTAAVFAVAIAPRVVDRFGTGLGLLAGSSALAISLLLLSRAGADATYWADIFPGFVLMGVGAGFAGMAIEVAAFIGVKEHESGLVGGIVETSREIGGALGVAVIATIGFAVATVGGPDPGSPEATAALVDGFQRGMLVAAAFAVAAALAAVFVLRPAEKAANSVLSEQ